MIKVFKLFCFVVFITAAYEVHAQQKSLSLKEILQIAAERSPEIKVQQFELKSKESLVDSAGAWNNPEFSVESERTEDSGNNKTESIKYGLSQTFSMPGRFSAKKDVAQAEVSIEKINLTEVELNTQINALKLAYEYAADIEKSKHNEERLKRFQSIHSYLKSRVFASPQKKAEATILSTKLLVLQKELEKSKAEVDLTWNRLNFYLGLRDKATVSVVWLKNPKVLVQDELLASASSESLALLRLKQEDEKSRYELKVAQKEAWPEFTLSGGMSDGSGFAPEKVYSLGLSVPVPIFSANGSVVKSQNYKSQASQAKLEAYKLNLQRLFDSAFINCATSRKSVLSLPIAKTNEIEKSFSEINMGFKKGLVDMVTFLEADSQHSETTTAIYNSQTEYIDALSELSLLTGHLILPTEQ